MPQILATAPAPDDVLRPAGKPVQLVPPLGGVGTLLSTTAGIVPGDAVLGLPQLLAGVRAAGGLPSLTQLADSNWNAQEARIGNVGASLSGALTVTAQGHVGQVWARVDAKPAAGGEWGVAYGQTLAQMDAGALGDEIGISPAQIVIVDGGRRALSTSRQNYAQAFYRPTPGSGTWLVASTPRLVLLTPQSATPGVSDWTLETYSVDPGGNGARIPRVGFLAEAAQVFYTTEADPVDPVEHPAKWTAATVEPEFIVLDGLFGGTGATLGPVRIVWRTEQTRMSGVSDAKSVNVADLPGAFTSDNASLVDAQLTTGNGLDLIITGLPVVDGGTVIRLEYETSLNGSTYGDTTVLPAEADTYRITATQRTWLRLRAVSDLGPGPWFVMDETPTVGSVNPAAVSIRILPAAPVVGQAVHFALTRATQESLAAAAGVSVDDFMGTAEFLWEFSEGNATEDYTFTVLPADHMGNTKAGKSLGPNAAHVYVDAVNTTHTVRCTVYRGGSSVGTGTRSLSVPVRTYTTANQGYLATTLPVAGSDGVPSGVTNLFSDVAAAFTWLAGAAGRALYVRRGQEFTASAGAPTLRATAFLGAYDATGPNGTTGARPIINYDPGFDRGARIVGTGNGSPQTFTGSSLGTSIYVYFNNALQVEGVGYTRNGNEITATVPNGQRIRVYNVGNSGRITVGGGALIRVGSNSNNIIIRGLDLRAGYNPASPGAFSRADLSTANRFCTTDGINGASGYVENLTVFDCRITGFGTNFGITLQSHMLACVNTDLSGWANYGYYTGNSTSRAIAIGCAIVQNRLAVNGTQRKGFNAAVEVVGSQSAALNAAWHGPMRTAYSFEMVINSCRMDSRTSWAGNNTLRAQPIMRSAQSTKVNQNYTFTQNYTSAGWGIYSGGAANETTVVSRLGMGYAGYNVLLAFPGASQFAAGLMYYTSISNIYLVPAGTGATGNLEIWKGEETAPYQVALDYRTEPTRSINDSILVLDSRPSNTFDINARNVVATPGLRNLASVVADFPAGTAKGSRPARGGYPIPPSAVGMATVRVPMNVMPLSTKARSATRVWRGTAEATATAQATVTARQAVYDIQWQTLALNEDGVLNKDDEWLDVTLKSGTWAAGETIWITREQCVESSGSGEIDEETGEDIGGVVTGTAETFHPNNRTEPVIRTFPQLLNTLVLFAGTWGSVIRDGATITPDTPATYGTWDAYWRPITGNTAINAAGSIRAAFDVRGQLRSGNSLGALEPDTDVTGWPAIPLVPAVSVALSPTTYEVGDAFDNSNITVTVTSAGAPTLSVGDVTKTAEVLDDANAVISTTGSTDLQIGEGVRARTVWTHPTVPRQEATTTIVRIADPNFVPGWISSNPDLTAPANTARNGGRVLINGLTPSGTANQHIAFRIRSRHNAALAGASRPFETGDFQLRFDSAGLLIVRNGSTNEATVGPIPATDGLASVLVSSYREGNGPGGAFNRIQIKIGDAAVSTTTYGSAAISMFTDLIRIFTASQGTADVDFHQFFGTWEGGVPDWSDMFEADGAVKDWRSNPTCNVAEMSVFRIIDGAGTVGVAADTFNGRLQSGARPWAGLANVVFGNHTLAGFGGVPAPDGATAISGPAGYTLASGRVAPTSTGSATAGRMTFTGSDALWDVTVQPNRWDVRTHAEMLETLAHASLAYGDDVRLRAGTYDTAETYASTSRVRRSTAINGTFTPPSDYGEPGTAEWYQGPDLDTGNYVRIRPDAGTVTITGTLQVDGQGAANVDGLRFSGLTFAAGAQFLVSLAADHIATDGFTMLAADPLISWDSGVSPPAGLRARIEANTGSSNFKAINHSIDESFFAIRVFGTGGGNTDIIGNKLRNIWGDGIQLGSSAGSRIGWNVMTDKKDGPVDAELHGDFIQFTGEHSDANVYGNILVRGTGYPSRVDGQGVFFSVPSTPHTGSKIFGNFVLATMGNGIYPSNSINPTVAYNTAITHSLAFNSVGVQWITNAANQNGRFYGNAADFLSIDPKATILANADLAIGTRAADFVNPDESIDPITSLSAFVAGWSPKTGGALDATVARGAMGRMNFLARTFDPAILTEIDLGVSLSSNDDSITITATTDMGSGTIPWMVTATEQTDEQVDAQGSALAKGVITVSASGAQPPVVAAGLESGTTYHVGALQKSSATISRRFKSTLATTGMPPFSPRSASFDGNTQYASTSVSIPAGTSGMLSVWFYNSNTTWDEGQRRIIQLRNSGGTVLFDLFCQTSRRLTLQINQDGTGSDSYWTDTNLMSINRWHHVLWAWDWGNRFQIYIDDVNIAHNYTFTGSTKFDMSGTSLARIGVGGSSQSVARWIGSIGHLWCDLNGQSLDISVEANRRKFITADGDAVNLGSNGSLPTGTAPQYYYDGAGAAWSNQGTAGNVTLTGTLAAGGTPALP